MDEDKFIQIVDEFAKKLGFAFFVISGEGRELITEQFAGEDLYGYLIPNELASEFAVEYSEGFISDKWSDYIRFAVWKTDNGKVIIDFIKPSE